MILSTILSIIHPQLYQAGQETLNCLRQNPKIEHQDVLQKWTSVFNSVSVICNHTSLVHQDSESWHYWYDLLATLGPYQNCNLELPGLGLLLEYGLDAVVGLSGMMLEYEVAHFNGERACYAYSMKDNIHEWAGVPGGTWMKTDCYE